MEKDSLNMTLNEFILEYPWAKSLLKSHICLKILFQLYMRPSSLEDIIKHVNIEYDDAKNLIEAFKKLKIVEVIHVKGKEVYILSESGKLFVEILKKEASNYLL
jgi:predicted transcriptional regulator